MGFLLVFSGLPVVHDAYTRLESYLPQRMIAQKEPEEWQSLLVQAHKQYGQGKSELIAMVW